MNLSHDLDNVRERLWRLAALAGWRPGNPADNEAIAELFISDALKAVPGHVREGHRADCSIVRDGECECFPPYADCPHRPTPEAVESLTHQDVFDAVALWLCENYEDDDGIGCEPEAGPPCIGHLQDASDALDAFLARDRAQQRAEALREAAAFEDERVGTKTYIGNWLRTRADAELARASRTTPEGGQR